jgi:4-amino-4-deoxy-L-arabinose transferase-like glycosyltransferase
VRKWRCLLLILFAASVFLLRTGRPAIYNDSDGMYAEVPREMVVTGDWLTPYANGVRYLEKPPLLYWLTALCYRIGGVSEVTARLPVALAAVATVWLCVVLGNLCFGGAAGLWAGLALATAPGYFLFTQQIMPDTLFTAWLSLAFYGFLRGYTACSHPFRWYLLFYLAVGLAVLTKGLIGLVFPVVTVGTFLALNRERRAWREMRPAWGALIVLAVAAPWHVAVGIRNPGFFWFYFVNEHLLRFLNQRTPRDYGTVPLLAFWALHAVWFFPWSFLLPLGARAGRRETKVAHRWRLERFPVFWAGSVLLFFSFSTRLEYYSMPAYPAIALLIGAAASRWIEANRGSIAGFKGKAGGVKGGRSWVGAGDPCLAWIRAALLLVGILVFGLMLLVLWVTEHSTGGSGPGGGPTHSARPGFLVDPDSPYNVFFFSPVFQLSPAALQRLRAPILGVGTSVFLGGLLTFGLSRRWGPRPAFTALAASSAAVLPWLHLCTVLFQDDLSSRSLARVIQREASPEDRIVVDGQFELYSSLAFYTGRRITLHDGRTGYLEYGSRYPDCPPIFLDTDQLARLSSAGPRLFYITRRGKELPPAVSGWQRLAEAADQVLVVSPRRMARRAARPPCHLPCDTSSSTRMTSASDRASTPGSPGLPKAEFSPVSA